MAQLRWQSFLMAYMVQREGHSNLDFPGTKVMSVITTYLLLLLFFLDVILGVFDNNPSEASMDDLFLRSYYPYEPSCYVCVGY